MNVYTLVNTVTLWVVPGLILFALLYASCRRVNVFDTFIEGAQEGFHMSVRLIPFLVGMIVAVGLFRVSGAMEAVTAVIIPILNIIGMPAEVLPLAMMRPVSGSSALAITTEIMNTYGPDSLIGRMAATMQGSTDTTLFVLTVYFGAVGIKRTRYALNVGLMADAAGLTAAVLICRMVFG
jgi:spore maturation protein B